MHTHERQAAIIADAAMDLRRDYVPAAPEHRILREIAELPTLSRSLFFERIHEAIRSL